MRNVITANNYIDLKLSDFSPEEITVCTETNPDKFTIAEINQENCRIMMSNTDKEDLFQELHDLRFRLQRSRFPPIDETVDSNSTTILPFNFRRFGDFVLLTNIAGDYLFLSEADFSDLVKDTIPNEELSGKLKARFFIADKDKTASAFSWLQIKYQTKRSYLNYDSLLLMVVPTLACNCECRYCQVSSKKNVTSECTMSWQTALRFCNFAMELPHHSIKIEFQGGEPTLAFEIVELIVKRLNFLNRKKIKDISFVICSNLLKLTNHQIAVIHKNGISVSTSLDGEKSIHNSNRPSRSYSSPYDETIRNISVLRKKGIYPSALVTITAHNISLMTQIVDTYIQNGFTGIFLRPLNNYGYAFNNDAIRYEPERFMHEYGKAIDYIIEKKRIGISIKEEYFNILLRKILTPFNDGFVDMQNPCALGTMCMIVDQHGDVYPSDESRMISEMGDHTWRMGNIHDNTIHEVIIAKQNEIQATGNLEEYPSCRFCAYIPYCSADPIRSYYINHYSKESYCGMKKSYFDMAFRSIKNANAQTESILRKWAND